MDDVDYDEILTERRAAEAEQLAEWRAEIVADIIERGAQPIDWHDAPLGDMVTDAMADAAQVDTALPYALVRLALREAGVLGDRRVMRALQEVAIRYEEGGYRGY